MIHVDDRGPGATVRLVTLDRPERRNALDHATLDELAAVLDDTIGGAGEGRHRVLVLAGAGDHFCAGADLTGVEDEAFVAKLHEVLAALRALPLPTIAAITGAALGGGTQLAVACDLRHAAPTARFGIPAAKLGLMVDQWTIERLAAFAGQGPARAMLLATHTYSGEEAFAFGLVQRLGTVADALEWADSIAVLAPLTIAGHKVGLNEAESLPEMSPAYRAAFDRAWSSADVQEGLAAFRERRPAYFRGA
jgi:enoyl-CoA hydratase